MEQFTEFAYLYDKLNVNYAKEKIYTRIRQLLCSCREVVDLCCGTGDVAIALAKSGLKVTGIDISRDMLNVASEKALKNAAKVLFVQSDAKDFELPAKIDAVYSLTDGMNYMLGEDELKRAFGSVYKALKSGGTFIFDVSTQYKYENIIKDKTFTFDFDDIYAVWENDYNKSSRICEMNITAFVKNGENTYGRFNETHFQYCFELKTVERTLKEAGFSIGHIYSGYSEQDITDIDERALIVAYKK